MITKGAVVVVLVDTLADKLTAVTKMNNNAQMPVSNHVISYFNQSQVWTLKPDELTPSFVGCDMVVNLASTRTDLSLAVVERARMSLTVRG